MCISLNELFMIAGEVYKSQLLLLIESSSTMMNNLLWKANVMLLVDDVELPLPAILL